MRRLDDQDDLDPWRREPRGGRNRGRTRKQMPLWQELPLLLVVAFCLAVLIRTFLLQLFYIPSSSMEDTLLIGDRVLVNKVVYDMRDPRRGEIVVFRGTDRWVPQVTDTADPGLAERVSRTIGDLVGIGRPGEKDFIKRVIGLPGDRVRCCDEQGRVTVNGVALDESSYVVRDSPLDLPPNPQECRSRRFDEVLVPPGQIFVMGDHRLVSQDARCQGPVPIDNVIGRAFVVGWPYGRWTNLSVPATFQNLPKTVADPAPPAERPVSPDPTGGTAMIVPILASLMVNARSHRPLSPRRRRLHW